jgi:hypothetical protein
MDINECMPEQLRCLALLELQAAAPREIEFVISHADTHNSTIKA